jgi:hypothetical protein
MSAKCQTRKSLGSYAFSQKRLITPDQLCNWLYGSFEWHSSPDAAVRWKSLRLSVVQSAWESLALSTLSIDAYATPNSLLDIVEQANYWGTNVDD